MAGRDDTGQETISALAGFLPLASNFEDRSTLYSDVLGSADPTMLSEEILARNKFWISEHSVQ